MKRFGLFRYGGIDFAVPLIRLRKILREQQIFLLPRLPAAVSGVLVDDGRIVPVLDLKMATGEGSDDGRAEYSVLIESEYGNLVIPADLTCGIIGEQKGATEPVEEGDATWLTGHFKFQDQKFQILDIDFLASVLTQGV